MLDIDRRLGMGSRMVAGAGLALLLCFIAALKWWFVLDLEESPLLVSYGLLVTAYLAGRILRALTYRPLETLPLHDGRLPRVRVVVPVMNEGEAINATIEAILHSAYPVDRLDIHVIDDGSTDNTWDVIQHHDRDGRVKLTRFAVNRGKRAAMAAGIRASDAVDVLVFIDSDSIVEPDAIRAIVSPLCLDPRVAGVAGHAEVTNIHDGLLARMQQVRYWAAFRIVKAAESGSGTITCASGCFSAWRRPVLIDVLDEWEHQTFLGVPATFGDDRALTNYVLRRDHDVVYQSTARCITEVPATLRRFCTQQMRWKRSWTRESLHLSRFVWKRGPRAAIPAYLSIMFQLAGPIVVTWSLIVRPLLSGADPTVYVVGFYAMSLAYGLMYALVRGTAAWSAGPVFALLYATVLVWQTYLAMATCTKTGWGTRSAAVTGTEAPAGLPGVVRPELAVVAE